MERRFRVLNIKILAKRQIQGHYLHQCSYSVFTNGIGCLRGNEHRYCSSSSWILPCEKQAMDSIRGFQIVFCSSWGGSTEVHLWQHRLRAVGLHSPRAGLQHWSTREVLFLFLAELFWILLICLLNVRALHNIYVELKGAGKGSYWKKICCKTTDTKVL